jgi:hypothetical protein
MLNSKTDLIEYLLLNDVDSYFNTEYNIRFNLDLKFNLIDIKLIRLSKFEKLNLNDNYIKD